MSKVVDEIKRAIETSGKSRYRVAQESSVSEAQLSRLFSGERGMSVKLAERLADCLGMELVLRPKRRKGR